MTISRSATALLRPRAWRLNADGALVAFLLIASVLLGQPMLLMSLGVIAVLGLHHVLPNATAGQKVARMLLFSLLALAASVLVTGLLGCAVGLLVFAGTLAVAGAVTG